MTAEIAILNNHGIALAADSFATLELDNFNKTYIVNKVFQVDDHPVAIMVYGSGDYMGLPWETVINLYGGSLDQRLNTLEDYSKLFIDFLQDPHHRLIDQPTRQKHFRLYAEEFLERFRKNFIYKVKSKLRTGPLTESEMVEVLKQFIDSTLSIYENEADHQNAQNYLRILLKDESYKTIWRDAKQKVLELLPIPESHSVKLDKCFVCIWMLPILVPDKFIDHDDCLLDDDNPTINPQARPKLIVNRTGVVIAGFGKEDVLPKLIEFEIGSLIGTQLIKATHRQVAISLDTGAKIYTFAQDDIALRFLYGIDAGVKEYIFDQMKDVISEIGMRKF